MVSQHDSPKHRQTTRINRLFHDLTDADPSQQQRNLRLKVGAAVGAVLISGILMNADKLNSEFGSSPLQDEGVYLPEATATQ